MEEDKSDTDNVPKAINPLEVEDNFSSVEDEILTWKNKLRYFLVTHMRGLLCLLVPIILIPMHLSFPPEKYQWCAYTLVLMAIFWVEECIPLAVTSFLPVVIFPLTGIMSTKETCACYMNDTIMMFLGSLWLAYAIEQSGLHKRLALYAIRTVGYSHYKLLFAMCLTTMFISMWITNTAAATMMVPINFALLKVFEDQNLLQIYEYGPDGERIASDITTCYFCAATFSASIGGMGSLVGTATNLVFKGLFTRLYPEAPEYLSFPKFSAFTIPLMIMMEILCYFYLIIVYFGYLRPNSEAAKLSKIPESGVEAAKRTVEENIQEMGPITIWEIFVIILFTVAILLFFSRSPQIFTGWGDAIPTYFGIKNIKFVQDSAAAILILFLMLLIPSSLKFFHNFTAKTHGDFPDKPLSTVLIWEKMNEVMPYSFMFLLGGGFALSNAAKKEYTDLNGKIGVILRNLKYLPNTLIILLIIIFTVFITNFASNVAVCNVIVPIAMQLAKEIDRNPLWYNIAAGLASSYAFCVPVGTPGNLIVQSAASIPTSKMKNTIDPIYECAKIPLTAPVSYHDLLLVCYDLSVPRRNVSLTQTIRKNMIKAGVGATVSSIIITWLGICYFAPVIWPDLLSLPSWIE